MFLRCHKFGIQHKPECVWEISKWFLDLYWRKNQSIVVHSYCEVSDVKRKILTNIFLFLHLKIISILTKWKWRLRANLLAREPNVNIFFSIQFNIFILKTLPLVVDSPRFYCNDKDKSFLYRKMFIILVFNNYFRFYTKAFISFPQYIIDNHNPSVIFSDCFVLLRFCVRN